MCDIYDPTENRQSFIPISRGEWIPLYPLWRDTAGKSKSGWWFLYECKYCGAEHIFANSLSFRKCDCQRDKRLSKHESRKKTTCINCGNIYEDYTYLLRQKSRHYCCDECKREYQKKHKPSTEWRKMSNAPRDYNLKKIKICGRYDGLKTKNFENVMG